MGIECTTRAHSLPDRRVCGSQVQLVHRTRSLIFMSAELLVGNRVVATANGVWKRWAQIVGPLVLIGPRFFDLICCHG